MLKTFVLFVFACSLASLGMAAWNRDGWGTLLCVGVASFQFGLCVLTWSKK